MNVPVLPNIANARLPQTYEQARAALAKCVAIDECKDWADKAEAMASYARQSGDREMRVMADRIQARALDRCGELMRQIPKAAPPGKKKLPEQLYLSPREQARIAAGMSKNQANAFVLTRLGMAAYYNEHDPYAAQWLRNLIAAGHIAAGDVDERSIVDVRPEDLRGYTQCHFFAGIGGWSRALRLSLWPDDRHVWTGSCPCQPFSVAGRGKAADDERHLWPAWFSLIRECRPATIFGEQVEAAIGWGWLDAVFSDLEAEGYACGAAVLPACGVGAPHIRQRLWFVGSLEHAASEQVGLPGRARQSRGPAGELANAEGKDGRIPVQQGEPRQTVPESGGSSTTGELADSDRVSDGRGAGCGEAQGGRAYGDIAGSGDADGIMGHASGPRLPPREQAAEARGTGRALESGSPWGDLVWLPCTDGKARPTQPGIFPLAHGVSARVGKLRAAGNAIVPQIAAEIIRAFSFTGNDQHG